MNNGSIWQFLLLISPVLVIAIIITIIKITLSINKNIALYIYIFMMGIIFISIPIMYQYMLLDDIFLTSLLTVSMFLTADQAFVTKEESAEYCQKPVNVVSLLKIVIFALLFIIVIIYIDSKLPDEALIFLQSFVSPMLLALLWVWNSVEAYKKIQKFP